VISKSWPKIKILVKNELLVKNQKLSPKFGERSNQKSKLWSKIQILVKNPNFA